MWERYNKYHIRAILRGVKGNDGRLAVLKVVRVLAGTLLSNCENLSMINRMLIVIIRSTKIGIMLCI